MLDELGVGEIDVSLWDRLVLLIYGKDIGFLGPRGSGKTHLHTYLRDGSIMNQYRPTLAAARQEAARPQLSSAVGFQERRDSRKLNIRKGLDIPGDISKNIHDWQEVINGSEVIIYVFDVYRLGTRQDRGYSQEMLAQCVTIDGLLAKKASRGRQTTRVAMLGTHCDQDPTYRSPSTGTAFLDFYAKIRSDPGLREAQITLSQSIPMQAPVVLGSLITQADASETCWRLFRQELRL